MTWSYDPNLTDPKDQVRFFVGDTQTADQQISNEEINGVLTIYGNTFRAAAAICRNLAATFSRKADQSIDDMSKRYSQVATAYASRAKELDAQADSPIATGGDVPMPYAGGISVSEKIADSQDGDRVKPFFARDDRGTSSDGSTWFDSEWGE